MSVRTRPGEALEVLGMFLSWACQVDYDDNCVEWPYSTKKGYPVIWRGHRSERVHVLVCTKFHGPRPSPTHDAAHSCGNQLCCNKRHLRWATHRENIADKKLHGTHQAGELHPRARLTERTVQEIRDRYAAGETQTSLAKVYGVGQTQISNVVTGISWSKR